MQELDLEVWVSTALRLSPEHTQMYAERLVTLARELWGHHAAWCPRQPPKPGGQRPTWCVTIDHGGTIDLGSRAILRKARGKVYRGGEMVGGGEERRWILPVRRRCTIRFVLYKRVGDSFISGVKFAFREPTSWDERLYGGVPVASVIRAAGEAEPRCPISLEEARQQALGALEPPRYAIRPEIYRRLLDPKIAKLRDVRGASVKTHQKLGLYMAHLSAQNRTPWFVHSIKGQYFGTYRGGRVYRVNVEFEGTIPPGSKHVFPCWATEHEDEGEAPPSALTEVRWSLKGGQ